MSKILVTGATGNIGSRVVRELLSRGQTVRAFTRSGDRARIDSRAEVANGDFSDTESLRKAMQGISKMFLLAAGQDLETNEANAIDAAKAAGIELIVKQSVAAAPYKATDIPRWHRTGEERIEASGLQYTFLRPSGFASNALYWAESIKSHDTAYGALGDAAIPVIDPEDIAAVAVVALTTPGHVGKAYELTGPQSLTTAEQVEILARELGRPLKYVNVPDSAMRDSMLGMGMPPKYVDAMVGLTQVLRNLGRIEPTGNVKAVLGREPRTFEQWAAANIGAFRPEQAASQQ